MSIQGKAFDLAMKAKAGVLNPVDVVVLVIRAARQLDPRDPDWLAIRDFGKVVCPPHAEPDDVTEAGNELLTQLGALEV